MIGIKHLVTGEMQTLAGSVPVVTTKWSLPDVLSTIRVRWAIGRMHYTVEPGIYAIGRPDENSHVFVTGNFKLTFDHVRRDLEGLNAWLLVLDTKGINVWCAAGKGTFATKELVNRINRVGLDQVVKHRKLIVPQLGAVGVSAHEVKSQTGFSVIYGPIRSEDIKEFVRNGLKASKEMRAVTFPLWERLKLIPVELSYGKYYLFVVPLFLILLSGLSRDGYSIDLALRGGLRAVINLLVAYLAGLVIVPVLLPWIPFRRFSLKGLLAGWLLTLVLFIFHLTGQNPLEIISWFLMSGGLSSFLAMNFTGSTTFTSLSGVQKEMKTALPMQITMAGLGLITWIISKFVFL